MGDFWTRNRIVLTGGTGFLGTHVLHGLLRRGAREGRNLFLPHRPKYDFRRRADVLAMLEDMQPDVIIHLAAHVGGIGANRARPAELLYDNAIMGLQLLHEACHASVRKFVTVGTVCAYPKHTPVPFREEHLWNGYPEETNAPYGIAKKLLLVQGQAYRQQHGFNAIYLLPTNLYGPGDNFDPASSHVIPALIRKCFEAQDRGEELVVWGSGAASRDFLYVADAAEGILGAAEQYDDAAPLNLGAGEEVRIRDLVGLIVELTGFTGAVRWDRSQPDGQPRRCLDSSEAERALGWQAHTPLREGLQETVDWYRKNRLARSFVVDGFRRCQTSEDVYG